MLWLRQVPRPRGGSQGHHLGAGNGLALRRVSGRTGIARLQLILYALQKPDDCITFLLMCVSVHEYVYVCVGGGGCRRMRECVMSRVSH